MERDFPYIQQTTQQIQGMFEITDLIIISEYEDVSIPWLTLDSPISQPVEMKDDTKSSKLTGEVSPQAKKFIASQRKVELKGINCEDDSQESFQQSIRAHEPIWGIPQFHCNRYDDPDWKRVAEILIKAQDDHPRHWKKYAEMIGGGHSKSTLVYWFKKLQQDPTWSPRREAHGSKNISLAPELSAKIWARIDGEFLSKQFLFTDTECQSLAMEEYRKALPELKLKKSSRPPVTGSKDFAQNIQSPFELLIFIEEPKSIDNLCWSLSSNLMNQLNRWIEDALSTQMKQAGQLFSQTAKYGISQSQRKPSIQMLLQRWTRILNQPLQ
jgi:hypothetical protein